MSPLAKIAISSLLSLFLGSGVVGHGAGTQGWPRMKPGAHHPPSTFNCWWWDHGALPSMGLTPAFVLQFYLLVLVFLHSSGNGELSYNSQSQPSLACTSQQLTLSFSQFPCTSRGAALPAVAAQQSSYRSHRWF